MSLCNKGEEKQFLLIFFPFILFFLIYISFIFYYPCKALFDSVVEIVRCFMKMDAVGDVQPTTHCSVWFAFLVRLVSVMEGRRMAHFCNNATDSFGHMQIMATTFTFGFGSNHFFFFFGLGFFFFFLSFLSCRG